MHVCVSSCPRSFSLYGEVPNPLPAPVCPHSHIVLKHCAPSPIHTSFLLPPCQQSVTGAIQVSSIGQRTGAEKVHGGGGIVLALGELRANGRDTDKALVWGAGEKGSTSAKESRGFQADRTLGRGLSTE